MSFIDLVLIVGWGPPEETSIPSICGILVAVVNERFYPTQKLCNLKLRAEYVSSICRIPGAVVNERFRELVFLSTSNQLESNKSGSSEEHQNPTVFTKIYK